MTHPDTTSFDPYLQAEQRGELAGLRASQYEYRRGFEDGFLACMVAVTIGAGLVVILTWWFA
jgi:hypothetical protein